MPDFPPDSSVPPLFSAGLSLALSCRDPDEMSERAPLWGLEEVQFAQGRFEGSIRGIHSDQVQLGCVQRNLGSRLRGSIPAHSVVLASVLSRDAPIFQRGVAISDQQPVWIDRHGEVDCHFHGGSALLTIAVRATLFHQVARATLGPAFIDDNAGDRLVLPGEEGRHGLNRRLLELLKQGRSEPLRLAASAQGRLWEHQIIETVLADALAPSLGFNLTTRHRAARQAESFLRAHCKRRVSITELCLETGVPKRTLMQGFRDLFGMPPLTYHRRMRLAAARRDLLDSSPGDTSVTTIALRWGFDHFGRFSVDYRRMFGEPPTTTLKQSRRS